MSVDRSRAAVGDDPGEWFDVVDEQDTVVGRRTRGACHADRNLIHRCVFILVYHPDGRILWQQRSQSKDTHPGCWVTSASGHVDAGESYAQAAERELHEELGIATPLTYLDKFLWRYPQESEWAAVFRTRCAGPFRIARREIETVAFMSAAELFARERAGRLRVVPAVHRLFEALGARLAPL